MAENPEKRKNKDKEEKKTKKKEEKKSRIKEKEKAWADLQEEIKKSKKEDPKLVGKRKEEEVVRGFRLNSRYVLPILVVSIILVSVIVCKLMVPFLAPPLSEYNDFAGSVVSSFRDVDDRIDNVVESIPNTANLLSITAFNLERDRLDNRIDDIEVDLNSTKQSIPEIKIMEYNLAGSFGNYTLNFLNPKPGNYLAKLNFLYLPSIGVGTVNSTLEEVMLEFYNNLTLPDRKYIPSLVYNTQWSISSIYFYTGKFTIGVVNSTSVDITFTGLNFTPNLTFVEVFKVA